MGYPDHGNAAMLEIIRLHYKIAGELQTELQDALEAGDSAKAAALTAALAKHEADYAAWKAR
jgi:hypothetical protein